MAAPYIRLQIGNKYSTKFEQIRQVGYEMLRQQVYRTDGRKQVILYPLLRCDWDKEAIFVSTHTYETSSDRHILKQIMVIQIFNTFRVLITIFKIQLFSGIRLLILE